MDISILDNHDFGLLDSFAKSTKSSLPNPLGQIHLAKSRLSDTFKTTIWAGMRRQPYPFWIGASLAHWLRCRVGDLHPRAGPAAPASHGVRRAMVLLQTAAKERLDSWAAFDAA